MDLFYRHSEDEKVTFIFNQSMIKSGEKPVAAEKPEHLEDTTLPNKKRKVQREREREREV